VLSHSSQAGAMPAHIIGYSLPKLFTRLLIQMFNKFYQSIFTNCDNYINSTAADSVHVDAITGTASVLYKDGSIYRYENVSRRAIIKFILDPARSLGKFINVVLKQSRVDAEYRQSMPTYVLG
jgi:hypothetical protein